MELLRRKAYVSRDGISLLLRPYCFDREAACEVYAYGALKRRIRAFQALELSDEMRNILRESYMLGRTEFGQWTDVFARQGMDLKQLLGEPLYRDREYRLIARESGGDFIERVLTAEEEQNMDPDLIYEQETLVKREYASREDLPEKLLVMNRYGYTENDTLALRDYRISCP